MVLSSSIVPRASSTLRSTYARIASASTSSTCAPMSSTRSRKLSSSPSYSRSVCRRCMLLPSAKPAGDVVFGALLLGAREDHVRAVVLDQLTQVEKRRKVRNARGLLHVVRDDDDRVRLSKLVNQLFDARGGDRIERRTGLVHQQHLGLERQRTRDTQALLLAA